MMIESPAGVEFMTTPPFVLLPLGVVRTPISFLVVSINSSASTCITSMIRKVSLSGTSNMSTSL